MVRERLTYANVAASLALFLTFGGVGYAATQLPSNSVGTSQLKPNAVTSSKVKNGTLLKSDFKSGQIPSGKKGATGAPGPAGPVGPAGPTGAQGVPGPLARTVPSGVTIRGSWALFQYATVGSFLGASASYPVTLPAVPTGLLFVPTGTTVGHCAGSVNNPTADPGYVCVYRGYSAGVQLTPNPFLDNPENGSRSIPSVHGFIVEDTATGTGTALDWGTYAYTAP